MRNLLLFTKIPPIQFRSGDMVFLKIKKKFAHVMGALGLEFAAYENFQIWVRGGITDTFLRIYFFTEIISLLKITLTVSRFQRTITHTLTPSSSPSR